MKKKAVVSMLIYLATALFLLSSISISGWAQGKPTPTKSSGPRYGGTLRIAEQSEGFSIGFPPKMVRLLAYTMRQAVPAIEPLFRTDKTGKPAPWLATEYKEDAAGKAITLTLRKGVKFHDGTNFNAEAVKWNLDQCISAKSAGSEKFKSIDVINDYAVRINLTEWDSTVISSLASNIGMIISPIAFKKNGEEWASNNPVGTGPFQFVSMQKDIKTTYKKFDGYWQKGKPYLNGVEWNIIEDTNTRQMSFRAGELDIALSIAAKDVASLEKGGFVVFRHRQGSGAASLIFDSANPNSLFANLKVRQAAQYAIDTEAIVKSLFFGEYEAANQYIYKGHWAYNPSLIGYPYNPSKAKQLLTEAGYPNGFKTKLTYLTTVENDQTFTAVQNYLKAVGIDAQMDPVQTAKYGEIAYNGGKWDGLIYNPASPNPDVAGILAGRYTGGGKFFASMLVPDDYLKAIQNAVTAPNFDGKQKNTQEAMKLMIDKYCLMIMLLSKSDLVAGKTNVHNHGFMESPQTAWWTPEDAWLE